ncbi:hypothetical protein ANN_04586 [Periplaneta americana]|uniref:Uncharacterized protein n=1 Tax=Periplaneta americana TaxID=6978 RepID=A0ABQ8T8W9_PERAM|nr:hypothetical protein ANN_04586 [Periplaneta americana]
MHSTDFKIELKNMYTSRLESASGVLNISNVIYFNYVCYSKLRNLSTSPKCYFQNDERDSKRIRVTRRDSKDKCNEHSERERQLVLFISSDKTALIPSDPDHLVTRNECTSVHSVLDIVTLQYIGVPCIVGKCSTFRTFSTRLLYLRPLVHLYRQDLFTCFIVLTRVVTSSGLIRKNTSFKGSVSGHTRNLTIVVFLTLFSMEEVFSFMFVLLRYLTTLYQQRGPPVYRTPGYDKVTTIMLRLYAQVDVCLDHVGPTHWEKKQKTSKEKVVGRVPERDWSAADENSEGHAGMENTGRNYEHNVNYV